MAYARPSSGITIRRLTGSSPFAGIAVGSETSGGVQNVLAEHINLYNMGVGIHIKTNIGRGGIIRNITFSNVYMENARKGIKISGDVGDHPDDKFNPNALPVVKGITIKDVWGVGVIVYRMLIGGVGIPYPLYLLTLMFVVPTSHRGIPTFTSMNTRWVRLSRTSLLRSTSMFAKPSSLTPNPKTSSFL